MNDYQGYKPVHHDWKIVAVLALAAVILISAFLGGTANSFATAASGFFAAFGEEKPMNISFTANVQTNDLYLNAPAKSIIITLDQQDTTFSVDKKLLDLSQLNGSTLTINDYKGEIRYEGVLGLDGSASGILTNGVSFKSKESIPVSVSGLVFKSIKINGVELEKLSYDITNGEIKIEPDKAAINLVDQSFDFGKFKGDFEITGGDLLISGITNALSVFGDNVNIKIGQ